MSKSNYLENAILDHILGGGDFSRPATVYVSLHTADPTDAGNGAEVSAAIWTNYAREAVTNNNTNWPAASGGSKSNGTDIDFGTATVSGTAPVVTHFGIWDASTSGNLLYFGALTGSKTIDNGDTVKFAASAMTISED